MGGLLNLLAPYKQSFAFDELEQDIQSLFIEVFNDLYGDVIDDIHHYGMPHLGSPKVVERFTKQDGLAVLRRPTSNDETMRVIYANWKSLSSKRGLSFLEFVLQMIWADQWEIQRLYHSTERVDSYPTLATTMQTRDSFLTSRINITLSQNIDVDEVIEIAPILSRLVPANIVAKISSGLELGEATPLQVASAYIPYAIQNVQYFGLLEDMRIPMTNWGVLKKYELSEGGIVEYFGYKTDLVDVISSTATVDLSVLVLAVMIQPEYYNHLAIEDALTALEDTIISFEVNVAGKYFKALVPPDDADIMYVQASRICIQRLIETNNTIYQGAEYIVPIIYDHFGWFLQANQIMEKVLAPINMRAPYLYQSETFEGFDSFQNVAESLIADKVANDVTWSEFTLGALTVQSSNEAEVTYIQAYSYEQEEPPVEPDPPIEGEEPPVEPDPPLPPVMETINAEYVFIVTRVDNPEFIAVDHIIDAPVAQIDLDNMLSQAKESAEAEADYTLLQNVNLATESAYMKDDVVLSSNTLYDSNLVDISFATVANQIILNTFDANLVYYISAEAYLVKIAETLFSPIPSERLITVEQLIPQFDANVL